jgi:hypothetical protein
MYFAMDEIGRDNVEKLSELTTVSNKWQFIDKTAKKMGFDGMQVTNSSFYKNMPFPLTICRIILKNSDLLIMWAGCLICLKRV